MAGSTVAAKAAHTAIDAPIARQVAYRLSLLCLCACDWHCVHSGSVRLWQIVLWIARGAVTMRSALSLSVSICRFVGSVSEPTLMCMYVVSRGASLKWPKTAWPTLASISIVWLLSASTSLIFSLAY